MKIERELLERIRAELHDIILLDNLTDDSVVKKSQELDELILKEMKEERSLKGKI